MLESLNAIRLADVADILIVSVFVFVLLRWLQTTAPRSLSVGVGLLVAIYLLADRFDLYLTTLLLNFGLTIAAIVLVVVYQEDIRRLMQRLLLAANHWKSQGPVSTTLTHADVLINAVFDLAKRKRGALIVFAGDEPLNAYLQGGTVLVGRISQPLLDSLFDPHSAGHDGAVIIDGGFVTRFGVHLPLSEDLQKCEGLGTRHRSALGLSERTDAMIVVVSEERGRVSLARGGELRRDLSRDDVQEALSRYLASAESLQREHFLKDFFRKHSRTKVASLLIAILAWFSIASQHDLVQRVFIVPIEYRNVPADVDLPDKIETEARVTFSATERAFQFVAPSALKVSVDLSEAARGKDEFTLTEANVRHPSTLAVYRIEPRTIRVR